MKRALIIIAAAATICSCAPSRFTPGDLSGFSVFGKPLRYTTIESSFPKPGDTGYNYNRTTIDE